MSYRSPGKKETWCYATSIAECHQLAQIIGTETVANIIINDAEACALQDCWSHDPCLCQSKELWQSSDSRYLIIQFQLSDLGGWRQYSLQQGGSPHHRYEDRRCNPGSTEGEIEILDSVWKRVRNNHCPSCEKKSEFERQWFRCQGHWPRAPQIKKPYTLLKPRNGGPSWTEWTS